jgi:hypothetical protein
MFTTQLKPGCALTWNYALSIFFKNRAQRPVVSTSHIEGYYSCFKYICKLANIPTLTEGLGSDLGDISTEPD